MVNQASLSFLRIDSCLLACLLVSRSTPPISARSITHSHTSTHNDVVLPCPDTARNKTGGFHFQPQHQSMRHRGRARDPYVSDTSVALLS